MSKLAHGFVAACLFAGCVADDGETAQDVNGDNGLNGAPEHVMKTKDAGHGGGGGSPLMTLHGGGVLVSNKTQAIFWGAEWGDGTNAFSGDKVSGLDSFFSGFGGSHYADDSTEYNGSDGVYVTNSSTYLGHVFDNSAAPTRALSTKTAAAEACKIVNNNPDPNALYLIYTSTGAGHVSYCAWHTWATCSNGAPIQVAYMPNLDGVGGCDPGQYAGHSVGLAALANVTAHELSETITDPRGGGWFDSSGQENGDKCAWSFPVAAEPVRFSNRSEWYIQGEWSNNAFALGTGYANRDGQNGCLY
jgi:hypothetical protein